MVELPNTWTISALVPPVLGGQLPHRGIAPHSFDYSNLLVAATGRLDQSVAQSGIPCSTALPAQLQRHHSLGFGLPTEDFDRCVHESDETHLFVPDRLRIALLIAYSKTTYCELNT